MNSALIGDSVLTLKPQFCPPRATGEGLGQLLQGFVLQSKRCEGLGASAWELDERNQLLEGICSGGWDGDPVP